MTKKKVVYKVIHLDERSSFIVYVGNKYCLHYQLNTIVKAIKETLGIMCFESKGYAEIFVEQQGVHLKRELKIIEVRPIGKASYPTKISHSISGNSLDYFYEDNSLLIMNPPKGTVCYKSVEVLT